MQKYQRQILLGLILVIGLYILFLVVADSQSQLNGNSGIGTALGGFDWRVVPVVIFFQCLVILCRMSEWHFYMGIIGARDKMSLLDSMVIFIASFTLVVSPGKAAELLKTVFVKAKTGVPLARTAPVVIAERVIDGLAVILLMVVTLLLAGDSLHLGVYEGVDYNLIARGIVFSSAAVLVGGLIVVQVQPLAYFCLNLIARMPLIRRLHRPLVTFYESSREIFYYRHVLVMLIPGTGVFLFSSMGFVVVLAGFGLPISWTLFLQAAFIVGILSAIGALSFVPNGAGVTEASNWVLLMAMIAPTHPMMTPAIAAAASLIQGFFHKWFRVLVGLAVALVFRNRLFSEAVQTALAEAEHAPQQQTAVA